MSQKFVLHAKIIFVTCFTHFSKTTAHQQVIFKGKLSAIIICKLCEFNVNMWTLCFVSYKKYPDPLNYKVQIVKTNMNTVLSFSFVSTLVQLKTAKASRNHRAQMMKSVSDARGNQRGNITQVSYRIKYKGPCR